MTVCTPASRFSRVRELVLPELRAVADGLPEPLREVVAYHFGWQDEWGAPADGNAGKALRPALVVLCAEAVGGSARSALRPAVAVELVHNFSLLHDDVIDRDATRRHRRTVWTVYGNGAAILAGDALLALAARQLADAPAAAGALSDALLRLVDGQSLDVEFERRTDVSLDECVSMAENKTAALLSCACELGGLAGGGDAAQIRLLREFGEHLGLAFQLVDDVLGIWGDPAVTGKPVRSDLAARKKTLPVVAALTSNTRDGNAFAELYRRAEPLSEKDIETAAGLVDRAGGRAWAEAKITHRFAAALACLEAARPAPAAARELTALARLITDRDH